MKEESPIYCAAVKAKRIKSTYCPDWYCETCPELPKKPQSPSKSRLGLPPQETIKDELQKKYKLDIEDIEIKKHIWEFQMAFDIELATRLNHAWLTFLGTMFPYICNTFLEAIHEEDIPKITDFAVNHIEPFVVKYEFKGGGILTKKVNDAINDTFIELQQICKKSDINAYGFTAVIKDKEGKPIKRIPLVNSRPWLHSGKPKPFKTPGIGKHLKAKQFTNLKPPRKIPLSRKEIVDRAIDKLLFGLSEYLGDKAKVNYKLEESKKWETIELIFKYYEINRFLPPSSNPRKQLANRYQRYLRTQQEK